MIRTRAAGLAEVRDAWFAALMQDRIAQRRRRRVRCARARPGRWPTECSGSPDRRAALRALRRRRAARAVRRVARGGAAERADARRCGRVGRAAHARARALIERGRGATGPRRRVAPAQPAGEDRLAGAAGGVIPAHRRLAAPHRGRRGALRLARGRLTASSTCGFQQKMRLRHSRRCSRRPCWSTMAAIAGRRSAIKMAGIMTTRGRLRPRAVSAGEELAVALQRCEAARLRGRAPRHAAVRGRSKPHCLGPGHRPVTLIGY